MATATHTAQEPSVRYMAAVGAEAARYALLRRLAPAMRHHLVVNLQPIGLVAEVMRRRLQAPQPDLAHMLGSTRKIHGFARAAVGSCLDVVTWLAPEDEAGTGVPEGVGDCVALLASALSFRGYMLRNEVGPSADPTGPQVRRSALRTVLTAVLVHATDAHAPPAELVLGAQALSDGALVSLRLATGAGSDAGFELQADYRPLGWSDVLALAESEGVRLERGPGGWQLLLPWMHTRQA